MKKILTLISFFGSFCICLGQEVTVEISFFDNLLPPNEITAKYNNITLPSGQWTQIDRLYNLPRFSKSMDFIVKNNRTDLLRNLVQISAYYGYLDNHPVVRSSKIKWQHEAQALTINLQLVPVAMIASYFAGKIYTELASLKNGDASKYKELQKMLDEGISPQGLGFMDGTASKKIVADVTKQFYSPLISGKTTVPDAFEFDAKILYREQFILMQPNYYDKFNDFDNIMIVGWFANLYAFSKLDLTNPTNRLYLGLNMMGYSEEKINAFISKIK